MYLFESATYFAYWDISVMYNGLDMLQSISRGCRCWPQTTITSLGNNHWKSRMIESQNLTVPTRYFRSRTGFPRSKTALAFHIWPSSVMTHTQVLIWLVDIGMLCQSKYLSKQVVSMYSKEQILSKKYKCFLQKLQSLLRKYDPNQTQLPSSSNDETKIS